MRVLHVNHSYERVGGAETCLHDLIKALDKEDVCLFALGKRQIKTKSLLVIKESNSVIRFFQKFFFSFKIYYKLKNYIRIVNPDIIHLHNHYKYSLSILLACSGKPVIQTVHDYGLMCPSSWAVTKDRLDVCGCVKGIGLKCIRHKCLTPGHFLIAYPRNKIRLYLSRKLKFIAPSKKLKEYLNNYGFRHVYHIPHFVKLGKTQKRETQKNTILYVGSLNKNKGAAYLLKAMPLVMKKIPDIRLRIVGTGQELSYLKRLSSKLNIHVMFCGKLSESELVDEYLNANVLVMPSIWMEQFGMVGIEAMSYGLPVIGSNIGGIPDWLEHGKVGYLVEPKNSRDIADKVIAILSDAEKFREFSKNAVKRAKLFSKERYLTGLRNIYKEIILQGRQ